MELTEQEKKNRELKNASEEYQSNLTKDIEKRQKRQTVFEAKIHLAIVLCFSAVCYTTLYFYLIEEVQWVRWIYYFGLSSYFISLFFRGFEGKVEYVIKAFESIRFKKLYLAWSILLCTSIPIIFALFEKQLLSIMYSVALAINLYCYYRTVKYFKGKNEL